MFMENQYLEGENLQNIIVSGTGNRQSHRRQSNRGRKSSRKDTIQQIIFPSPLSVASIHNQTKNEKELSNETKSDEEYHDERSSPLFKGKMFLQQIYLSQAYKWILVFILNVHVGAIIMQGFSNEILFDIGEIIEKVCQSIFSLNFLISIISHQTSTLMWLIFDFITISTGITSLAIRNQEVIRYFKAIRALKIFHFYKILDTLQQPLNNCLNALKKIKNMLLPGVCIIYLFACLGLYTNVGLQYQKCRDPSNKQKTANWTVAGENLCGKIECPSGLECLNPLDYNVEPNPEETNIFLQGYGLLTYSDIGNSILITLNQAFVTGSTKVIVLYKRVIEQLYIATFFFTYIWVMPIVYLNIFYGLIISNLQDKKENQQDTDQVSEKQSEEQQQQLDSQQKREERELCIVSIPSNHTITSQPTKFYFSKPKKLQKKQSKPEKEVNFENTETQSPFLHKQVVNIKTENIKQAQFAPEIQTKKEQRTKENCYFIYKKYIRPIFVLLTIINLSLDFENQSDLFSFGVDCAHCALMLIYLLEIIFEAVFEKIKKNTIFFTTKADIAIFILSFAGLIYEWIEASSFDQFLAAETRLCKVLRCLLYLRLFVYLIEEQCWFKSSQQMIICVLKGIWRIRYFMGVWFLLLVTFSISGYHLFHGRTLVDENGKLDLENGTPHQVSFATIYHSFVFITLTVYNEEWDYLMFQEYVGSGTLIVIWQIIILIVGMLFFSKHLLCLLAKQIGEILDECYNRDEDTQTTTTFLPLAESINQIGPSENGEIEGQERNVPCCQKIRNMLQRLVENKTYVSIRMVWILISGMSLNFILPHTDHSDTLPKYILIGYYISHAYFLIDLILHCISYGIVPIKTSYFGRNPLNIINFVIVIVEFMYFTPLAQNYYYYRVEKIKALRILYLMQMRYWTNWEMKILLRSMFQLIPIFLKLFGYSLMIYYFFALVLTKLYKEDYYYCANEGGAVTTKEECLLWGGDWVKRGLHFATPLHSLLYLFLVATMEGWIAMMGSAMDMAGAGRAPSYNSNEHMQLFFLVFFLLGNLLVLNSFVSLSLFNYKRIKERETGEWQISAHERTWLSIKLQILRLTPTPQLLQPESQLRKRVFLFCEHKGFKVVEWICFVCLIVHLSLYSSDASVGKQRFLKVSRDIFLLIVLMEFLLEIIAYGCCQARRNILFSKTFLLLYGTTFWILINFTTLGYEWERILGGMFFLLLVFRYTACNYSFLFVVIDDIPLANKMVNSIVTIVPRVINIMMFSLMTFYFYILGGMELFAFLRPNVQINAEDQNYTDMKLALFSLTKFSILESPITQIEDASQQLSPNFVCFQVNNYEDYLQYGQNGCGSPAASYIFFLSFHIIYGIFLMSSTVAFVVDAYEEMKREEEAIVNKFLIEKVNKLWQQKDPEATGIIDYDHFLYFCKEVLKLYASEAKSDNYKNQLCQSNKNFLHQMKIPAYEDENGNICFLYHDIVEFITKKYLQKIWAEEIEQEKVDLIVHKSGKKNEQLMLKKTPFMSHQVKSLFFLKYGLKLWKKKVSSRKVGKRESVILEDTSYINNVNK